MLLESVRGTRWNHHKGIPQIRIVISSPYHLRTVHLKHLKEKMKNVAIPLLRAQTAILRLWCRGQIAEDSLGNSRSWLKLKTRRRILGRRNGSSLSLLRGQEPQPRWEAQYSFVSRCPFYAGLDGTRLFTASSCPLSGHQRVELDNHGGEP